MGPEFEEFALEFDLVAIGVDLGGGFELDVVYWSAGWVGGFDVPDLPEGGLAWGMISRRWNGLIEFEPTSVHLATDDHFDLAKAGADDGAVLSVVVDDLVMAGLDELP